jgi:hypothetical protein
MTKASLALAALLLIPATAAAQSDAAPPPASSPAPAAPPAGYAPAPGYPPGYAPAPGYPPGYAPAPGYPPAGYAPAPGYAPPPGYAPYGYPPGYPPAGPGVAQANPLAPRLEGFVLSFALGYAPGWGDAIKDNYGDGQALTDVVSSHVPLILGVGYRFSPLVSAGGIFQYGIGQMASDACGSGNSCSARDSRVGVEVRLHFAVEQSFSPWISGGFGYEWLTLQESYGSDSLSLSIKGWELLNLEAGGDFRVNPTFTLGPFLGLRVARFSSESVEAYGQSDSADIPSDNQAIHGWVVLGVRGAFTL